ncbi:MAG: DNA-binding protein [Clostridia bacterium]|nr:DNA-binding protein [Clostridia bacterium]
MEDLHFMRLWDRYSPLLTDIQREITNLYFNFDLSLAEIAEEKGCSRQSVSDCLNKCRKQLEEYEEKLHLVAITEALEAFGEKYPEHKQEVEQISESGK